jgi:hypothetical protein
VVPEIVATLASGIFAGAALYVNFVEQPARLSCGVELAITEWRPSYKRWTVMQAPLAAIGSLAALVAWWFGGGVAWLAGGLLLLLIIPFTLIVIFPTNKHLENQELDLRSEEAGRLLRLWGRLHAVRSALGTLAFVLFVYALVGTR